MAQAVVTPDERIARARSLAAGNAPASAILVFYADLIEYQRTVRVPPAAHRSDAPSAFASEVDFDAASGAVGRFLAWLERHAPPALAERVAVWRPIDAGRWRELMVERVVDGAIAPGGDDQALAFVVDAVLQPFAESAAAAIATGAVPASAPDARRCPVCGGAPVVAALREEGHGARRVLFCGLCASEWSFLRVHCPVCEEQRFDALPVYSADAAGHVRVDACDSCRTYIKTVDLTKDGRAVPIVDDLATLPLDLWARDRGYQRLSPNLLRV